MDIRLSKPNEFYSVIQKELMAASQQNTINAKHETDRILASVPTTFLISLNNRTILYLEDFSFFFGYQITAYEKAVASGKLTEILSFSGSKILVENNKIQFLSEGNKPLTLTGSVLREYFIALDNLLSEVISFLEHGNYGSEDLCDFEQRLEDFLDYFPTS